MAWNKKHYQWKGTVREALKEESSTIEEGKADIMGLYLITKLTEQGVIKEVSLKTIMYFSGRHFSVL